MKLSSVVGLALLLALTSSLGWCSPARKALVIGNDTYPGNSLQNSRNDARSIYKDLTALGYASTLALDVDRQSMTAAINIFASSLSTGDTAILYYAGHGLQVNGENYLVPVDFRVSSQADVRDQGVALHNILSKMTEHGATTQIIVLDACRNNPFLGSRSFGGGWANVETSAGTFLAFGTAPGSTASDDEGDGHGLFTNALLHSLTSNMDIEDLFQRVRQEVVQKSHGQQVPWTSSSLIGSFHFDPRGDQRAPGIQSLTMVEENTSSAPVARSVELPHLNESPSSSTPSDELGADEGPSLTNAVEEVRGLRFDKALTILKAILSVDPRCAIALRLIGVVYHLTGHNTEATDALTRAIQIDSKDALAYGYLCLIGASEGSNLSRRECETAVSMRRNMPEGHLGLALNDAYIGDTEDAYAEAEESISLRPHSGVGPYLYRELATSENRRALAQHELGPQGLQK